MRQNPVSTGRARSMRRRMTPSEAKLWLYLRGSETGYRFRRQQPLGGYIGDFVCHERRLVIELDGSQHEGSTYDRRRNDRLLRLGYRTLRFTNEQMAFSSAWVKETITAWLADRTLGMDGATRPTG